MFQIMLQLQVFRKEIQKREYYISRIVEAGTERHAIPEENVKVVVRRWEVTKRKVTVLEEKLWQVGTTAKIGSRLSNLLLWLHEAESLIGILGTGDENAIDVPPKFLLKQHEVGVSRTPLFNSVWINIARLDLKETVFCVGE